MIDQCACKRGFFTLRDCPNQATTACSICTRRVCDEHLAPRVDARVCVECAARQAEQQAPGAAQARPGAPPGRAAVRPRGVFGTEEEMSDPTVPYRARRRFYDTYDYHPWWWASRWGDPYYDDYDSRYMFEDEDDAGGFGDS